MIKYIEYESQDETGSNISSVNSLYHLNKTASGTYSPEIMKVVLSIKRRPDRYYVVINALGSYEIWGSNRNGDAFPQDGLSHKSLRTDMGTNNDYGYKTFEYYAVLFKHHVNKDPKKNFGEVLFSHWNPIIQRVELIVAINTETGKDIVDAIESGENVGVSMGCKVKYDRCCICDNKAKTRMQYCKHLKNHMNEIIDEDTAKQWSKELNRLILPGTQVFAYNDHPRFFDISKVHVGADRTSFILGKAASEKAIASVDIAEAYGVTDEHIDKLSMVGKNSEIEKNIGGSLGPTDIDGLVSKADRSVIFRKALDEKMNNTIVAEPRIPNKVLDSMSILPIETIFSTMLGMGIYPKPSEVQRIIIVKVGDKDLANELDKNNQIFDYKNCGCGDDKKYDLDISNKNFSDSLSKILLPYLADRSFLPSVLKDRMSGSFNKESAYNSMEPGMDYWRDDDNSDSNPFIQPKKSTITPVTASLVGLGTIYGALKLKSMGYGVKQISEMFVNKPWLRSLLGGGVMWRIFNTIDKSQDDNDLFGSASNYEGVLQDTNFSGHIKNGSFGESGELAESIILPASYINNAVNQESISINNKEIFPGFNKSLIKNAWLSNSNMLINNDNIERINKNIYNMILRTN